MLSNTGIPAERVDEVAHTLLKKHFGCMVGEGNILIPALLLQVMTERWGSQTRALLYSPVAYQRGMGEISEESVVGVLSPCRISTYTPNGVGARIECKTNLEVNGVTWYQFLYILLEIVMGTTTEDSLWQQGSAPTKVCMDALWSVFKDTALCRRGMKKHNFSLSVLAAFTVLPNTSSLPWIARGEEEQEEFPIISYAGRNTLTIDDVNHVLLLRPLEMGRLPIQLTRKEGTDETLWLNPYGMAYYHREDKIKEMLENECGEISEVEDKLLSCIYSEYKKSVLTSKDDGLIIIPDERVEQIKGEWDDFVRAATGTGYQYGSQFSS